MAGLASSAFSLSVGLLFLLLVHSASPAHGAAPYQLRIFLNNTSQYPLNMNGVTVQWGVSLSDYPQTIPPNTGASFNFTANSGNDDCNNMVSATLGYASPKNPDVSFIVSCGSGRRVAPSYNVAAPSSSGFAVATEVNPSVTTFWLLFIVNQE